MEVRWLPALLVLWCVVGGCGGGRSGGAGESEAATFGGEPWRIIGPWEVYLPSCCSLFGGHGEDSVGGVLSDGPALRFAYLFLALGKDFWCPPGVSCTGSLALLTARAPLLGCLFFIGEMVLGLLLVALFWICWWSAVSPLLLSSPRLPILVQRNKSILTGGPGWWLMRLYQGLGSHGGRSRGESSSGVRPGVLEFTRKMNSSHVDCFVIFLYFGGLVVKGGLYCAPV